MKTREDKEKFLEEYLALCRRHGLMVREGQFPHGDSWWSQWKLDEFEESLHLKLLQRSLGAY